MYIRASTTDKNISKMRSSIMRELCNESSQFWSCTILYIVDVQSHQIFSRNFFKRSMDLERERISISSQTRKIIPQLFCRNTKISCSKYRKRSTMKVNNIFCFCFFESRNCIVQRNEIIRSSFNISKTVGDGNHVESTKFFVFKSFVFEKKRRKKKRKQRENQRTSGMDKYRVAIRISAA